VVVSFAIVVEPVSPLSMDDVQELRRALAEQGGLDVGVRERRRWTRPRIEYLMLDDERDGVDVFGDDADPDDGTLRLTDAGSVLLATTIEAIGRHLGSWSLRIGWLGDRPAMSEVVTAAELARRTRRSALRADTTYVVASEGPAVERPGDRPPADPDAADG